MDLLELTVTWHDTVIDVRHLRPGQRLQIRGDDPLAAALPEGWLLARHDGDDLRLRTPAAGQLHLLRDGAVQPLPPAAGPRGLRLGPGDRARLELGPTTLYFARVPAEAAPAGRPWAALLNGASARGVASAALLHAVILALLASLPVDAAQLSLDAHPEREVWVELRQVPLEPPPPPPPLRPLSGPAPRPRGPGRPVPLPARSRPSPAPGPEAPGEGAGGQEQGRITARRTADEAYGALEGALAEVGLGGPAVGERLAGALGGMYGEPGPTGDALSLGGGLGGPGRGAAGPWGAGPSVSAGPLAAADFARGRRGRGEARLGERRQKVPEPVFVPQEPKISEGLSREEIQRVIRSNRARYRHCYAKALQGRPDLQGKVGLKFTIGPDGAVLAAFVEESDLGSQEVQACLVQQLRRTAFPAPRGRGVVVVRYPFLFKPAGG